MESKSLVRRILELIGAIESKEKVVRRRLAVVNQAKPRGKVSVILEDMGPKQTSAVIALRKLTGLNLTDTLTIANEMLPIAILRHVSPETAVLAQEALQSVGAVVGIVGETGQIAAKNPITESRQMLDADDVIELAAPEPETGEGEFVVILNSAGLLPDRIAKILQELTGWRLGEVMTAVTQPPQPILLGVDEDTAFKAQRDLQMYGAVVDVLRWDEYDRRSE
ncbi:MAG: ribosomal protein L7/L12 [Anaerolineae bacterium]